MKEIGSEFLPYEAQTLTQDIRINEYNGIRLSNVDDSNIVLNPKDEEDERVVTNYTSLLQVSNVDEKNKRIEVVKGNYFSKDQ